MNLIKPKKLNQGDTICIIAPAGEVDEPKISKAKQYFENKGFNVKLGSNITKQKNYLAGEDSERLNDLENAFKDKNINAIVCARGGYGAIRLINKLDYNLIKNNPKIFCGYSDITALSAMIFKKTGLITFSAPMAQSDFSSEKTNTFTENKFFQTLTQNISEIRPTNPKIYKSGNAKGLLIGGNLSTLTSLCGIDFIPDEDFVLFAEDLNEPAYKIDRYFTQLLNIEDLKKHIKGIILGDFLDLDNEKYFDDLIYSIANEYNIPIYGGYPISHSDTKASIPYGAMAKIEDDRIKISPYLSDN